MPRYSAPGSRSRSHQACAASVSARCSRSRSRSVSTQPRSRGHALISASWARSTRASSTVSSRAATRRSSTASQPGAEFGALDGAAGVLGAVAGCDHAQEQRPREGRLRFREAPEDVLGGVRDGAPHAADRLVRGQRERLAAAPPPDLAQRVRHEREAAGLLPGVGHDPRGQRPFDDEPLGRRGPHDRFPQPVRGQRPDEQRRVPQGVGERPVLGETAVEVGAHGDDDAQAAAGVAGGEHPPDEPLPLAGVVAEREGLLELVDDEEGVAHRATTRAARAVLALRAAFAARLEPGAMGTGGPFARGEDADRGEARAVAALLPQRRDQTRPQQGRLAAAGRADDRRDPAAPGQGHEFGDEVVAAVEAGAVAGAETGEAGVGRSALLRGGFGGERLAPARLPRRAVAAAGLHVREQHGQRGQPVARGRRGQGRRRVRGARGEGAVGGAARFGPELAEVVREPLDGTRRGLQWFLPPPHRSPFPPGPPQADGFAR
ncbi:hypothetical protein RB200_01645 [Streptomyces sp. PmtG]